MARVALVVVLAACSDPAVVPAHNGCMIVIQFTRTSTGAKSASLNVAATPGGSDSFAITGRGL